MLEIGDGGGERSGDGRIERAADGREQQDAGDPGADLELAVGDVVVRHTVAREMEEGAEHERTSAGADERATGGTRRDVQRDDQAVTSSSSARRSEPT